MARNPLNRWISSIITLSDEMSIEFDWNISERWKYLSSVKIEHYKCLHFNYANITTDIHSFFYLPINITELVASIFECQRHNLWEGGKKINEYKCRMFSNLNQFHIFFCIQTYWFNNWFFCCFSSVPQKLVDFTKNNCQNSEIIIWHDRQRGKRAFGLHCAFRVELNWIVKQ